MDPAFLNKPTEIKTTVICFPVKCFQQLSIIICNYKQFSSVINSYLLFSEKQATLRSEEISKKTENNSFILNETEGNSYTRMKTVYKCNINIGKFCYIQLNWIIEHNS